jgi:membrane fusion protein (multidrug efflux system)
MVMAAVMLVSACSGKKEHAMPPPAVEVGTPVVMDVPIYKEWVGTTDGIINAKIHARVKGYLKTRNYHEGSIVKENELLFTIDDRDYKAAYDQANGQLLQAKANAEKSQLDVNRFTPLAKEGAVSQKELDDAIQQNQADRAQIESAKASLETAALNLSYCRVTSPIGGIAGISVVQIGDLVDTSTDLTTVSKTDPIKVIFQITENEYLWVRKWNMERFKRGEVTPAQLEKEDIDSLDLILSDGSTFPHKGSITVADRQVDIRTGTITLNAYFPNPDKMLKPGQYGKVRALVYTDKNVVVVPIKSILEIQGVYMLVVIGEGNKVTFRPVKVGPMTPDNASRIILSGVKAGERIVFEGLQKARPGQPVTPMTAEQMKALQAGPSGHSAEK